MNTKEIARTLTTITEEQWEAILIVSQNAKNLSLVHEHLKVESKRENKAEDNTEENELRLKIVNLLKRIGVPPQILGYSYIQDAVMLVYKDGTYIHNVVKQLYPDIAKMHDTIGTRVERAIRHAFEIAYSTGDVEDLKEIFNTTCQPTNSYAIAAMVEYIKMCN